MFGISKKRENMYMGQERVVLTCCKEECQESRSGQKGIAGSGHQGNSLDSSLSRRLSSTEKNRTTFTRGREETILLNVFKE